MGLLTSKFTVQKGQNILVIELVSLGEYNVRVGDFREGFLEEESHEVIFSRAPQPTENRLMVVRGEGSWGTE